MNKLCTDCKYCEPVEGYEEFLKCGHVDNMREDITTGNKKKNFCEVARMVDVFCGPEANRFEPKDSGNSLENLRKECSVMGGKIEQEEGFEMFAKLGVTALNKLLVKKGLITEEELLESFHSEVKEYLAED